MKKIRLALLVLLLSLAGAMTSGVSAAEATEAEEETIAALGITAVEVTAEEETEEAAAEKAAVEETGETAEEEETEEAEEEEIIPEEGISILVKAESPVFSLLSMGGKTVGAQTLLDKANTEASLEKLQGLTGAEPVVTGYNGAGHLVEALYAGEVEAILFNETYRPMIKEEFPDFNKDTRILYTFPPVYEAVEPEKEEEKQQINVSQEPFILYFSGIDSYGDVAVRGRSDVNILGVVNPSTRQVLLLTTPRDLYVELPVAGNAMDKLTHAGIYGINASVDTLEQLYDIDINYYLRMNFSGFMQIIDALGGVDVYSDRAFTGEVFHVHFDKGYNHVDGQGALSFVRERHSFRDGDFQRQRNQMELIKAVMRKVLSPSILTSYTTVLQAIPHAFNTDMSYDVLLDMAKTFLFSGDSWNIQTYGLQGTGVRRSTYSMGSRLLYVVLQNETNIAEAKGLIQTVLDGESLPEAVEAEATMAAEED